MKHVNGNQGKNLRRVTPKDDNGLLIAAESQAVSLLRTTTICSYWRESKAVSPIWAIYDLQSFKTRILRRVTFKNEDGL